MTIPPDYKQNTGTPSKLIPIDWNKDYTQSDYNEATYTYPKPITQKQRILDKLEKLLDILLEE